MVQTLRLLVVSVSLDGEQFAERVMEGGTWCWFSHITVLPRVVTAIFVAMITPSVCAIVNCSLSWTSGHLVFFHMTGTKCNGIALRSGKSALTTRAPLHILHIRILGLKNMGIPITVKSTELGRI
jgi:hypothetical protein